MTEEEMIERLRDVINAEAIHINATPIVCTATIALLAAQLCHKHCGLNVKNQDLFLADIVAAAKNSLVVEGYRP